MSEVFELGDQSSGVGFGGALAVPVRAKVVVRLVALQHPVGGDQDRMRDRDLSPTHPPRFINRACRAAK